MEPLSVRYRDVVMGMIRKSRGVMQVTDENVFQTGNEEILPYIDRILEETLEPGSEIRGFENLVALADGKPALIRAENVVPLYRRNALSERQLLAVNEVAGVLDTAALAGMRRQVAGGADPQAVAGGWLAEHPLGR